jgi:hypothetical protein
MTGGSPAGSSAAAAVPEPIARLWPTARVTTPRRWGEVVAFGWSSHYDSGRRRLVPGRSRTTLLVPQPVGALSRRSGWALPWARWYPSSRSVEIQLGASSCEHYLAEVLGVRPSVVLVLRTRRSGEDGTAVLQILDSDLRTAGYAKVGVGEHGARLVAAEAGALRCLASAATHDLVAPRLLHVGEWQGMPLIVTSALVRSSTRRVGASQQSGVMQEIAGLGGLRHERVVDSGYAQRLWGRLGALAHDDGAALLHQALSLEMRSSTSSVWRFGSWHGELTSEKMAWSRGVVNVWGWEHFDSCVPWGYDALHLHLQTSLRAIYPHPAKAGDRLLAASASILGSWGVAAEDAAAITTTFLVDMGARYLDDEQRGRSTSVPPVRKWLLHALARQATRRRGQLADEPG